MAATAATHFDAEETVRPDFQILFYPVVSLDNEITHQGTRTWLLGKNPDEETVRLPASRQEGSERQHAIPQEPRKNRRNFRIRNQQGSELFRETVHDSSWNRYDSHL